MTLGGFLAARRGWGAWRVNRVLAAVGINANRRLCELTSRQRIELLQALGELSDA